MTYTPSLEDFLQWEDEEVTTQPNAEETTEEVVEEQPVEETPETVVENQEPTQEVQTEEAQQEEQPEEEPADEGKSSAELVFNIMTQSGLLALPEDFKFDGSVDKLVEALDKTKENMQIEMAQNLWERLPENFRTLLEYGLAGGTDLNAVQGLVSNQLDLNKINLEDEAHQKMVVETYLKKTTKLSPEKINERIKRLYDSDLLEDEATEYAKELVALQKEEKQRLVQEELERKKEEEQEIQKAYRVFHEVTEKLELPEKRKKDIMNAVWVSSKQYDGKNNISLIEHIDNQIRNNPEHFAQLVNIYLDYDPNKGFNKVTTEKKAETKAAKNLRDTLQNILGGNPIVSSGSTVTKGNSDFDFEQFIKYN